MKKNKMIGFTALTTLSALTLVACSEKESEEKIDKKELVKTNTILLDMIDDDISFVSTISPANSLSEDGEGYPPYYGYDKEAYVYQELLDLNMESERLEKLKDSELTKEEVEIKKLLLAQVGYKKELLKLIESIQIEKTKDEDGMPYTYYELDYEKEGFKDNYEKIRTNILKTYQDNYDLFTVYYDNYYKNKNLNKEDIKEYLEANFLINNSKEDLDDDKRYDGEVLNDSSVHYFLMTMQSHIINSYKDLDATEAELKEYKQYSLDEYKLVTETYLKNLKETKETSYYKNNELYKNYVDFIEKEIGDANRFITYFEEEKYDDIYIESSIAYSNIQKYLSDNYNVSDYRVYYSVENLYLIAKKPEILDSYLNGDLSREGYKKLFESFDEENSDIEEDIEE